MTKRYIILSTVLAIALLGAAFSSRLGAEPITFRFEGRLWGPTIPTTYLDPPVLVGAQFTGTYTFDLESAEQTWKSDPYTFDFNGPPNGMVIEFGPHRFATDALRIYTQNDAFNGESDRYDIDASLYEESGIEGFETSDIELLTISWFMSDSTASALSDSNIPTIPLDLERWDKNLFRVSGWTKPNLQLLGAFQVMGEVTSLSRVPEPDTLVLAVVGLLFMMAGCARGRRQHRTTRQASAAPNHL